MKTLLVTSHKRPPYVVKVENKQQVSLDTLETRQRKLADFREMILAEWKKQEKLLRLK